VGALFVRRGQWQTIRKDNEFDQRCIVLAIRKPMKEGSSGSAIRSLIPSHRELLRSKPWW
jgi:hypothetical protein